MKVLWFNHRDPLNPQAGGAEVRIHEVGKRLVANGYRVKLVCERWKGAKHSDFLDGIEIVRTAGKYGIHLRLPFLLSSFNDYDVVVDDVAHGVPWFSSLFTAKPVIGQVHHVHQEVLKVELPWHLTLVTAWAEKAVKYLYDTVVAVSESTKQNLIEVLGVPSQRVKVVLNGVDHGVYCPSRKSSDPLILSVGRVKRYKRVEHIILAFREVKKTLPAARLVILGDGDHLNDLKRFATRLAVPDVEFLGRVDEPKKVRLMGQSWLMAGCSLMEGWGMTVIEGAACGTPFVAYDVPGFSDSIRNGETGILVEDGRVDALASAMLKILQNENLRFDLSDNALSYSTRFSWDAAANEFVKVLDCAYNER